MSRSSMPTPEAEPSQPSLAERWQRAQPEARRALIVDAALDLLQREGLAAVTMRNVASQLGVGTMTLYTYVDGQHGLHRQMVGRGFEMLSCQSQERSVPTCDDDWLAGGQKYLRFALEHPNLYKLMFDHPMDPSDSDLMHGGFQSYLHCVTEYLASKGACPPDQLPREARLRAGRWWITLHGLAMLALAGRLCVLEGDLDALLRDLLPRVGPM